MLVEVSGWPRWLRNEIFEDEKLLRFGVQKVMNTVPIVQTTLKLNDELTDENAETEAKNMLASLPSNCHGVVFTNSINKDGTRNEDEIILLTTMTQSIPYSPPISPPVPTPASPPDPESEYEPAETNNSESVRDDTLTDGQENIDTSEITKDEHDDLRNEQINVEVDEGNRMLAEEEPTAEMDGITEQVAAQDTPIDVLETIEDTDRTEEQVQEQPIHGVVADKEERTINTMDVAEDSVVLKVNSEEIIVPDAIEIPSTPDTSHISSPLNVNKNNSNKNMEDDEPQWLKEALLDDKNKEVVTSQIESEHVTNIVYKGKVVETIYGIIPPPQMRQLASQRTFLAGPNGRIPTLMVSSKLRIGLYFVSESSFTSSHTYEATSRVARPSSLAAFRRMGEIPRLNRARRVQQERR